MATTEYLITIGGMFQVKGAREFSTAMISSVQEIPNEWSEFDIQKFAIEMLFNGNDGKENSIHKADRETFVMNLYRAVPNNRRVRAPDMSWMSHANVHVGAAGRLTFNCTVCGVTTLLHTTEQNGDTVKDFYSIYQNWLLKHRHPEGSKTP